MTELTQDPYKGNFTFAIHDLVGLYTAHKRDEFFNEVRILSKDVLKHLDGLCCNVSNL